MERGKRLNPSNLNGLNSGDSSKRINVLFGECQSDEEMNNIRLFYPTQESDQIEVDYLTNLILEYDKIIDDIVQTEKEYLIIENEVRELCKSYGFEPPDYLSNPDEDDYYYHKFWDDRIYSSSRAATITTGILIKGYDAFIRTISLSGYRYTMNEKNKFTNETTEEIENKFKPLCDKEYIAYKKLYELKKLKEQIEYKLYICHPQRIKEAHEPYVSPDSDNGNDYFYGDGYDNWKCKFKL